MLAVGSTWVGVAGVNWRHRPHHLGDEGAAREGVAGVPSGADTDGVMVDSSTAGVVSTGSNTGIRALLLDASLVAWTLCIEDTLRSAVGSSAYEAGETGASFMAIHFPAESIRSTWVRNTGYVGCRGRYDLRVLVTVEEGVAAVTLGAAADGVVIDDLALGVGTTCSWAWVNTLLLDTCLAQLAL